MAILGKRNTLSIVRAAGPGLYLDGGELGEILLPGRYIPADLKPKDKLDVFVYRDSEDLDWGLAKDLLLPFREQEFPVRTGDRVVVYVCLDVKTNRILASTRLNRHLDRSEPPYRDAQPVELLITRRTPLGYTAIVENAHRGLLYHDNLSVPLAVGQKVKGFVRTIRPGGKIDLSLDASGYKRVAALTDQIAQALKAAGGRLPFDDDSTPESIRKNFAVSKKAFKQALGKLYKMRRIRFTTPGIELVEDSPQPAPPADGGAPIRHVSRSDNRR